MENLTTFEEFLNESSQFVAKGDKLNQLEISESYGGGGIKIQYYNGSFGKMASLIIDKDKIDDLIAILNKLK
jgi:hypothetical protein